MQQFNPAAKGKSLMHKAMAENKSRKANKKYAMAKGAEYMQSKHLFEMYIGGESTGERKRMLGREAKLQNGLAMLSFGSGKDTKLHVWRWQKREEEAVKAAAKAILKGNV